jgi:hypothetical protein
MSTFSIPNQGQIRQVNKGDQSGELWGTFNIDLSSNPGKLIASKRLTGIGATSVMDNDEVGAFCVYDGDIWVFGAGRSWNWEAYRNPRVALSSSTTRAFSSRNSDAVVFNGLMLISGSSNITSYNGSAFDDDYWTTVLSGSALTAGKPHIMDVSRIGQETLFVTDGNVVRYYNTTAGHDSFTLASHLTANCIATDYASTWVGTYSSEGSAYVYEVKVGNTIASASYKVEGTAVLSMDVLDGIPYIVTDYGHVQAFNGRAFVTVATFPFAHDGVVIDGMGLSNIASDNGDRAIHPKGMRRYNRSFFININTNNQLIDDLATNPLDDDGFENIVVNERSSSGVWEFNTETGVLNHRYSLANAGKNYTSTAKGYHRQLTSGPILITDNQYTRILTAGKVDADTTEIFAEEQDGSPLAYFITPEITAQTVQEAWEKVALKTDTLSSGESIELKYRTRKVSGYPKYADAIWTSETVFVSTSDCSSVSVGDEVEIIDGYGAGLIAHVTAIESSLTTYTFTLDRAIGLATETGNVRFQNWKLIDTTYDENNGEFKVIGITQVNPWIQFKTVFNGAITARQFLAKGNAKTEL